jgi:hypothetical protein
MSQPPTTHVLNLATQAVLLYGSWAVSAVVLAVAIVMGRRERTWLYPSLVVAVGIGAFAEPLYDTAMMLYFYSTRGMVTHFTAFGIPQPLWTHSGYVVLYAIPALAVTWQARRRTLTLVRAYRYAALEFVMSCAFEIIGINGGTYTYWGPHVFRVLNYPLIIGLLETAQVVAFAAVAIELNRRVREPLAALGLFVAFPCVFLGVNFGAGWPVIIAIHLVPSAASTTVGVATLVSAGLALVVIHAAARVCAAVAGHTTAESPHPSLEGQPAS